MWRMHKLFYKRQLHGQRNPWKVGKNEGRIALNVWCQLEDLKPMSKSYLHLKSHIIWRDLGIQAHHHHLLWEAKDYHFTTKNSKLQVWAIVEGFTWMIMTCVMNQSHVHWLLLNDLIITNTLIVKLKFELIEMLQVSNGTKVMDQFDLGLFFFQRNMREEVVKNLKENVQFFILKIFKLGS